MKNILKNIFAASLLGAAVSASAQSIAFVGFNADGTDDLAFVTFSDIAANTSIIFTDNEWSGSAFNTGESYTTWTATSLVSAGSIVVFNNFTLGTTASIGTLAPLTVPGSLNRGFSSGSETVYAYIGTLDIPTQFLAYINSGDLAATTNNTGLSGGKVINLTNSSDGAVYRGARSSQAAYSDYLPLIGNVASNWTDIANGDGNTLLPFDTTAFTVSAIPEPSTYASIFGVLALAGAALRRRSRK